MKIVVNQKACYGCRVCELICTYHHQGVFGPRGGSIRVHKNNLTGKIRVTINSTCDLCREQSEPVCVRHCAYNALKVRRKRK